jgi:hypothetical protein
MKKFIGLSVIVVVIIGTRGALAAEPDADLEPQLVSDVQSISAGENAPTACRAPAPCRVTDCPQAICDCGCETGCVPRICDGYEVPGESVPFADGDTGAALPAASHFSFRDQASIASSVICNCTENHGPELRYMWMGDATASASYTVPHAPGWTNQLSYQSPSHTAELNIRMHFDWFDGLTEFRYANLKDQLSGAQSRRRETSTTAWNAQNSLFGAQIGDYGNAVIYGNSTGTSFAISDNLVSFNPFNFANTSLQLTPHIALRGGYQVLWLDGVAVAGKQVPTTGSFNFVGQATSHVDSAGTIINQCAKPGLEVTW